MNKQVPIGEEDCGGDERWRKIGKIEFRLKSKCVECWKSSDLRGCTARRLSVNGEEFEGEELEESHKERGVGKTRSDN